MKTLRVALAQMSPILLNKQLTMNKIADFIDKSASEKPDLIVFGEALLPGYPFWLSFSGGAEFNSSKQKEIHAHYIDQAVDISKGELDPVCRLAEKHKMAVYLGIIEKAADRSQHSLYCSLVYIDKQGEIKSVHRKLQPTYEERLAWSPGDGNGMVVHRQDPFVLSGLNCWENWMPLSRTALYAQGSNVHVAVWPGCVRNTVDITRYIAIESRSYVISVSGLMHKSLFPDDFPFVEELRNSAPEVLADGGSCIAKPDGSWLLEPQADDEDIYYADLDISKVYQERQNFDPSGHYSRPDVTRLVVNRERQGLISFED